jgi:hypothetical protein
MTSVRTMCTASWSQICFIYSVRRVQLLLLFGAGKSIRLLLPLVINSLGSFPKTVLATVRTFFRSGLLSLVSPDLVFRLSLQCLFLPKQIHGYYELSVRTVKSRGRDDFTLNCHWAYRQTVPRQIPTTHAGKQLRHSWNYFLYIYLNRIKDTKSFLVLEYSLSGYCSTQTRNQFIFILCWVLILIYISPMSCN